MKHIIGILVGLCMGVLLLWAVLTLKKESAFVVVGAVSMTYVAFMMVVASLIYAFELCFRKKILLPGWATTLWFVMCLSGLLTASFWWLYM